MLSHLTLIIIIIIIIIIWLCRVLVLAHGVFCCGTWAPEHMGSVVAVHGLSCPVACGILVPQPGIKPASPALEGGFLTTGPPGKSLFSIFISKERIHLKNSRMFTYFLIAKQKH